MSAGSDESSSRHAEVELRGLLQQRLQPVAPEDFETHQPISVHFTGAISLRPRAAAYKGSMFAALPGDIVMSKIDARSGAIAIVPASIAQAVVTSEFPVFTPDPNVLDGRFVAIALRTHGFLERLKRLSTGTSGRKRVTPDGVLSLKIPLPDLSEQRAMVAAYDSQVQLARGAIDASHGVVARAVKSLEVSLGLEEEPPPVSQEFFATSLDMLNRWSHEASINAHLGRSVASSTLPMVQLGDVVEDLENGWSPQCLSRPAAGAEWGVLKLGAVSFGSFDPIQNKALPPSLQPKPRLEVQQGDLLISRANVTRLVGAIALVEEVTSHLLLCDKIFRVVPLMDRPIEPEFLAEVLRLPFVRRQIEAAITGTSPTMKNISKPALLALEFPMPPKEEQSTLADRIRSAREESAALRRTAAGILQTASADFERLLLEEPGQDLR